MRKTIKWGLLASILLFGFGCAETTKTTSQLVSEKTIVSASSDSYKHWVWARPNAEDTDEQMAERYKKYFEAGVVGIYFEADSERHYRAAKEQGLQAHRWMWIMNRGDALKEHPEWAAINRSGKSTATNPPYVDYYKWMCPSQPEVAEFLKNEVKTQLEKDYTDGIHMDYVRFSDVVLAANLWQQYNIVQTEELPEYDFCYCSLCKANYKTKHGKDIDQMDYPQASPSWRSFRYNAVNNIVNQLTTIAKDMHKPITAAVFPTPDVAKKLVLQDWTSWDLDAVYPMIYHGFYKEEVSWIGEAVKEGKKGIQGKFPLYAGLYMPDFTEIAEVEQGIKYALENGADGISIFGEGNAQTDEVLGVLSKYRKRN